MLHLIHIKKLYSPSIISIILAFTATIIENRKVINRVAGFLGISGKFGDENLFSMSLNSKDVEYIYLRDIKNQLTYHGWVKSFSKNDNISVIQLCDVAVYNYSDSEFLYEVGEVYLSLNKQEIIIELAKIKNDGKETTEQSRRSEKYF